MSFDLCSGKPAEHPFFIASVGIRIYSIEELCWFLHHNLYLIDSGVTSPELVAWVRDELGLKALARKLTDALDRPDSDASYFILPIFQEIGYLSPVQTKAVREELTKAQVRPEEERTRTKADYLVKGGRFAAAITLYRHILDNRGDGKLGTSFYSGVWNNLGCAYARLFRFREAADAFLEGWRLVQSRELMRKYVSTLPLFLSDEEYRKKLIELGADSVLTGKIQEYNAAMSGKALERINTRFKPGEDTAKAVRQLREEYRRNAFS